VEDESEIHDGPSPTILKIAFIEELLTISNAAYKSVSIPFGKERLVRVFLTDQQF